MTIILGLGSPHGEDQIAWQVVHDLKNSAELQSLLAHDLQMHCIASPQFELLQYFSIDAEMIVIDAVKSRQSLGKIHCLAASDIKNLVTTNFSSHGFGLVEMLALAENLDLMPKKFIFYGIEIMNDNPDAGSHPKLEQARQELCHIIIEKLFNKNHKTQ